MPTGIYQRDKKTLAKLAVANLDVRCGPNNGRWKGDDITYNRFHLWLKNSIGKPDHCDICGRIKMPDVTTRGTKRKLNYFEWSNRTGVYSRNLKNWWQLCRPCHKAYDFYFLSNKSN